MDIYTLILEFKGGVRWPESWKIYLDERCSKEVVSKKALECWNENTIPKAGRIEFDLEGDGPFVVLTEFGDNQFSISSIVWEPMVAKQFTKSEAIRKANMLSPFYDLVKVARLVLEEPLIYLTDAMTPEERKTANEADNYRCVEHRRD
jgi:hypothetical protein